MKYHDAESMHIWLNILEVQEQLITMAIDHSVWSNFHILNLELKYSIWATLH